MMQYMFLGKKLSSLIDERITKLSTFSVYIVVTSMDPIPIQTIRIHIDWYM